MAVYEIGEEFPKEENLDVMLAIIDLVTFGEANKINKWMEAM